MNLTKATKPKKRSITRKVKKIIKPAREKVVDTGRKQKVEIVELDGTVNVEERAITEKVLLEPEFKDKEVIVDTWEITTTYNGTSETHQFLSKADADRFYEGFK